MRMLRASFSGRAAAVVLLCASLCGQTASAASRLSLAPKVMLPPTEAVAAGTEMTLGPEQVVLKARLGWLSGAKLDNAAAVAIGGRSATLPAGSLFIGAIVTGGDLKTAAGDDPVFCSAERGEAVLGITSVAFDGAPALGSRQPRSPGRLCLMDRDRDRRFERAVLLGAKRDADQSVDIEPVPYQPVIGLPMTGESEVRIVYESGSKFRLEVLEAGERQKFGMLSTRLSPSVIMQSDRILRAQTKLLPQRMMVGSAVFTVLALDKEADQARVRIDRNFSLAPYALGQGPQTLYIYVPR